MAKTTIKSHTHFYKTKTTTEALSMNRYSVWHYRVRSQYKKDYVVKMFDEIKSLPVFVNRVDVTFQMARNDKRSSDKSNFYSVISKFLFDGITQAGKWIDDNDKVIRNETILETLYDKDAESCYCLITFEETDEAVLTKLKDK